MAMEAFNGVVLRPRPGLYSGGGIDPRHRVCIGRLNRVTCEPPRLRARSLRGRAVAGKFDEEEHIQYYAPVVAVCGEQRKKVGWNGVSHKKRAKLVKDLAKNLSMFSELGFGLEAPDKKAVSEAALVLQAHLENLRAEGKRLKERKMECLEDSSSSSSSESSDSECENDEVVDMSLLRSKVGAEKIVEDVMKSEGQDSVATAALPISVATSQQPKQIEEVGVVTVHNVERNCSNTGTSAQLKRVEVCMGGKCKKMGGQVLIDEFRRVVGAEALVVECKCMGMCKTAPNMRILNGVAVADGETGGNDDSVRSPSSNPLLLGVRLDDVGFIAANYVGSELEKQQGGLGDVHASPPTSTSLSV